MAIQDANTKSTLDESQALPLGDVRNELARLWFIGSVPPIVIIFIQSITDKYGERPLDHFVGFSWLFPLLTPTLAVIGAVLHFTKPPAKLRTPTINRFYYKLCWWCSLLYLVSLACTPLLQPASTFNIQDFFLFSTFALAPFQFIVIGLIMRLFLESG